MNGISITQLTLAMVLAPLIAGVATGIWRQNLGRLGSHSLTILGVSISFIAALVVAKRLVLNGETAVNVNLYTWGTIGPQLGLSIGFLIDRLSSLMCVMVNLIALLVHIYSIGYMKDDHGYQRFFSYLALFTFAMLMLVLANNFLQLFFGWEGVGLISYLLIGFWFTKESANQGSLKAFLVNRVGDIGLLLAIAAIFSYTGSLNYLDVFNALPQLAQQTLTVLPGSEWSLITVICLLLFIGAMGKSAQMPLHVWLPESMEGPTPISALIHAATMVTAGIYMECRLAPLTSLSTTALSVILIIGASTALFTGLIALVQTDIKRVVAYSTLSQLGYMVAAIGAGAYASSLFHLFTHACFKALLFLAAGSVILALHHQQDMRHMGGLAKRMPITCGCFLIGACALAALPPFAGFYSKDAIITAVHATTVYGHGYAYACLLMGSLVTALYIFRAFFMVFHTPTKVADLAQVHEPAAVVTGPLLILALLSLLAGGLLVTPLLAQPAWLQLASAWQWPNFTQMLAGAMAFTQQAYVDLPVLLSLLGLVTAWLFYVIAPNARLALLKPLAGFKWVLEHKYGFDAFNEKILVKGVKGFAHYCQRYIEHEVVERGLSYGSARLVALGSSVLKRLQSGYLYHYALVMIIGLIIFILKLW